MGTLEYVDPVLTAAQSWVDGTGAAVVRDGLSELERLGDGMFRTPVLTMLADVLTVEGHDAEAAEVRREAARLVETLGQHGWLPVLARTGAGVAADVS